MKNLNLKSISLVILFFIMGTTVYAQQKWMVKKADETITEMQEVFEKENIEALTTEQIEAIKKSEINKFTEIKKLKKAEEASDERKEKIKALRKANRKELKDILSKKQFKAYANRNK